MSSQCGYAITTKNYFYKKRGLTIANSRAFCLIIYSKRDVFAILTAYLGDNGIGNIGYVYE